MCRRRSGYRLDGASERNSASKGESLGEGAHGKQKREPGKVRERRQRDTPVWGTWFSRTELYHFCGEGVGRWVKGAGKEER